MNMTFAEMEEMYKKIVKSFHKIVYLLKTGHSRQAVLDSEVVIWFGKQLQKI